MKNDFARIFNTAYGQVLLTKSFPWQVAAQDHEINVIFVWKDILMNEGFLEFSSRSEMHEAFDAYTQEDADFAVEGAMDTLIDAFFNIKAAAEALDIDDEQIVYIVGEGIDAYSTFCYAIDDFNEQVKKGHNCAVYTTIWDEKKGYINDKLIIDSGIIIDDISNKDEDESEEVNEGSAREL